MHYCPQCKYEYESRVTVCPDCGSTLVDGPEQETQPESPETDTSGVVLAIESQNNLKIQFFGELLESEGIPHLTKYLGRYESLGTYGISQVAHDSSFSSGPMRVFVAPEDLDRAKELWDSLQGRELTEDDIIEEEDK